MDQFIGEPEYWSRGIGQPSDVSTDCREESPFLLYTEAKGAKASEYSENGGCYGTDD